MNHMQQLFDIDSPHRAQFSLADQTGLETCVLALLAAVVSCP